MRRIATAVRISFGLTCLTMSSLFIALALGFVPNRVEAILLGRKALCESVAVHCADASRRGDLATIKATLAEVVRRNPEILSAAVRSPEGEYRAQAGDHGAHWGDPGSAHPSTTHMEVPISQADKPWGTVEFRFHAPPATGFSPFGIPALGLVSFVALTGFLAFCVYLRFTLPAMEPAQADAIPKRVRAALNTLAEGVLIMDKDQKIALANESFAQLIGQNPEQLEGCSVADLPWSSPQPDAPLAAFPWTRALDEGIPQRGSLLGLQANDNPFYKLSINSAPILSNDGSLRGAMATFDNLNVIEKKNAQLRKLLQKLKQSRAEIQQQNLKLRDLATRDPLTGCLNRRSFFADFETHWNAAARYGHPLSCVMFDIDHFKSVNDTYGHSGGDLVLQQVAETLNSMARNSDLVCRYGGEEFCILLPHVDLEEASQAAERFRQGIESHPCGNIKVTASLGVSSMSVGAREMQELLDQADKALYAAKRGGRNRYVRWDELPAELLAIEATKDMRTEAPRDTGSRFDVPIPFHAVTALVSALAYRHPDTAEHSRRLADLCAATANGLMSQSDCYVLEVAALLHDIGKLGVPDAVLLKPGPLNEAEWKVIRTHERIGDEIIAAAFTSPPLTAIIRCHHCWFGGNPNNPEAPEGYDIPVGGRILAIADAFDAMVSDRVYRKARTFQAAFAELRRCAGTQFDPELVERFIEARLARDDSRVVPALSISKQTALRLGMQIESLAQALDDHDAAKLATLSQRLKATASEHGIIPIAEVALRIEQSAAAADWIDLTQSTIDLLELCRSTYSSYLPKFSDPDDPLVVKIARLSHF